ncbi:hypothetical protein B4064_1768 [Caldibacillus thermoamylovorans]|uniref:glycosyltransferase family 1 protein n=1 Tax=Caldibacillus thermoamylovorans TaxID=35841 RepID=UPI0005A4A8B2|nr:glycosyltransferase family 1 protein [Caldibacillus thermoamylovorans]KIO68278.1 hypothetical protein B4064_1768 [Caldibacillus thermoamylovorans]
MKKPIRVLQVFARMDRGGAETMIMNLYRKIDRSKVQFDFIVHTNDKCAYDDEIRMLGGRIFRIPKYTGSNHMTYMKSWMNFIKSHPEYRIIHGHVRSTASIYLRIAKKFGLITIAHSHNTSSGKGISAIVKNVLQYPIKYIADYMFSCSIEAGKWLFGKNVTKKDNFYILCNAIDLKKFSYNKTIRDKLRKDLKIQDKFVLGHVGRFHAQKNHSFIIDIFKEVYDRNQNSVLLLVGDGELRTSIENKIKKFKLEDNVIFTGVRTDIPELLQAMDVFLFPSLYEGLPVTLVEAQASGLVCIVSDNITNEINLTELVVPTSLNSSSEYWANIVLKYNNDYKRKNTYEKIKNNGYDINQTVKWLESFYLKTAGMVT